MSTHKLRFHDQAKSGSGGGLAIVFFVLGVPHLYSFLRQRSNRKSTFGVQKTAGLFITMLTGALVLLII